MRARIDAPFPEAFARNRTEVAELVVETAAGSGNKCIAARKGARMRPEAQGMAGLRPSLATPHARFFVAARWDGASVGTA